MLHPKSHIQPKQKLARMLGVVLLLLMYMAQPVLAAQAAFCGCGQVEMAGGCHGSSESTEPTPSAEPISCCATKIEPVGEASCCSQAQKGEVPEESSRESVCHCPPKPVDSTPTGVVFDGQAFEGPFVWWFELESHMNEWTYLAPHLGSIPGENGVRSGVHTAWPPGGPSSDLQGPTGLAPRRLQNSGLIAFLADLSVANL